MIFLLNSEFEISANGKGGGRLKNVKIKKKRKYNHFHIYHYFCFDCRRCYLGFGLVVRPWYGLADKQIVLGGKGESRYLCLKKLNGMLLTPTQATKIK